MDSSIAPARLARTDNMGRAILAISDSAAFIWERPLTGVSRFWHELTGRIFEHYRPERHYMRGPGPAWRAKHGQQSAG